MARRTDYYYDAKKKLWRKQVTIRGRRKVFSGKTKQDVMLKILEYEDEQNCPIFATVADAWEEQHWTEVRNGTLRCYGSPLKRIRERFGDKKIDRITPKDVQSFLNLLGRDYSAKTVAHHKSIISMIFKYAIVEMGLDLTNPAERVQLPAGLKKSTRSALTERQISIVSDPMRSAFILPFLIYWTGLRCGEALALQWKDVDFAQKSILVSKSVAHVGNRPTISPPKTKNAYRTIPLLDPLLNRLKMAKMDPDDYITTGSPEPMTKSALDKRWKKWCRENGLMTEDGHCQIDRHTLRHQYATILYEAGIEPKSAQHLMGHADIKTTLEIYTHISGEQFKKDAEALNGYANTHQIHTTPSKNAI